VVASYIYKTADGKPYLRVQRTAAKKFWQQHLNGAGWEKGAPKGPRIPYRLPELLAADPEGEKDADRLASLGFVVTTTSGGSNGKWTPELSEPFAAGPSTSFQTMTSRDTNTRNEWRNTCTARRPRL
jgi:hypothetical protein